MRDAEASANAFAFPGVGEATARMSAAGQARSDSAWMVETNCEPMMPTPTCFMVVSPLA